MVGSEDVAAKVLVIDDEPEVADAYAKLLSTEYDVEAAYDGEAGLAAVDGVDVVLLDRRMPGMSGDEVLERIRERRADVRVVMVTAIDPGFDILDMPFDDYLCKPVGGDTLRAAVAQQLAASNYDDRLTEYFEVTAKMGLLEQRHHVTDLQEDEEYVELTRRADRLRAELEDIIEGFDDLAHAFREIDRV